MSELVYYVRTTAAIGYFDKESGFMRLPESQEFEVWQLLSLDCGKTISGWEGNFDRTAKAFHEAFAT